MAAADAAVVLPVPGPGADLTGVVMVGRRGDDRPPSPVDLAFIEPLAASAGLALGRLRSDARESRAHTQAARECPDCGTVSASTRCRCGAECVDAPVPSVLAGRFRLDRRLGAGGMGTVYAAWDEALARRVAVKTLVSTSAGNLARLKQEARMMAALSHPAIAQIYGLEVWSGRPCLVVELLAGGTLADRLETGPLPPAQAARVAASVAGALQALHAAGYLHGDVKPSNIGFTTDEAAKLFDFGLAGLTDAPDQTGGTVAYLSPEVLTGAPPEAADDVWSLAVVLYEMVTGRHPFAAGSVREALERIRRQRVDPPTNPPAPAVAPLAALAKSVLAADRCARPATARDFAAALAAV